MSEIWRDIAGYEGSYQVSNLGRVRSLDRIIPHGHPNSGDRRLRGRMLRLNLRKRDGYVTVNLTVEGNAYTAKVHRLVACAFHGHRDLPWEPDHENGDRSDNRATNLSWKSPAANKRNRTVSTGQSGTVGVFPHPDSKTNPWRCYVTVNYRKKYIGAFPTIEAATAARNEFLETLAA